MKESSGEIRVGFPYGTSLSDFDPARVQVAGQYALLENLYLSLLSRDNEGRLIPGAAEKFYWVDDEIEFVIRDDLVDSGGQKITVEDAYFSLMRLLILGSSTHGDLKKLICSDTKPQTLSDKCSGLRIVDGKLRIKPSTKTFTIFESFSTIDFAVIPRRSVDKNDIHRLDLSITSGVYSIKERRNDGSLILEANTKHFLYTDHAPKTAIFVPTRESGLSGSDLYESRQIDFLSPLDQSDISERLDRYRDSKDTTIFQTLPVRLELLVFTSKGLKLSSERRWSLGNILARRIAAEYANKSGYQVANQYFPEGGKGSLSKDEMKSVVHMRNAPPGTHEDGSNLVIGFFARNHDRLQKLALEVLPNIKVVSMKQLPEYDMDTKSPDYPDMYIVSMDTGFLENLPNIVNSLKSGFLGSSKGERETWISEYLHSSDEDKRLSSLRDLHKKSLLEPVILPILRTPYVSLIRKPWRANFSFLFPNSPLWKISRD